MVEVPCLSAGGRAAPLVARDMDPSTARSENDTTTQRHDPEETVSVHGIYNEMSEICMYMLSQIYSQFFSMLHAEKSLIHVII